MSFVKMHTKQKGKVFIGAVARYDGAEIVPAGAVFVGFTATSAYIFKDAQGLFNLSDLNSIITENPADSLYLFDEYTQVASIGSGADDSMSILFNDSAMDIFLDIEAAKSDIKDKLLKLSDHSVDREVSL